MANSSHDQDARVYTAAVDQENTVTQFTYTFDNFYHPYIGELITRLNQKSLNGILDAKWQEGLKTQDPDRHPELDFFHQLYHPHNSNEIKVKSYPKEIEVKQGPYANYNWELFFHIPLTIAIHLSKNQRFAEAQRWFHYIFNPTSNDQSEAPPKRFWKFLAFRNPQDGRRIEDIVRILSTQPTQNDLERRDLLQEYNQILYKPFQPHAVAHTRPLAYQYNVVMKYLDNLIAWGDHLFQQDSMESINEATQVYVLAANILGERPQKIPPQGMQKAKTFASLRNILGPIGDALVNLEGQFPFNLVTTTPGGSDPGNAHALFGIGRTLYFCIPPNDKMLAYWDIVADRLFKIRHCMNIAGVVRPLALFDPPLDPGMLVKAAAAGIDIGSIVSGLNQPPGPVRSLYLIQKALELCSEVRNLGNNLLSTLEKGDAEHLALIRQRHEIQIQQMTQNIRFLQWKAAQEATKSLLTSRRTALERLKYYKRLLGLSADTSIPDDLSIDQRGLSESNFDEAYNALVQQYDNSPTLQQFPNLRLAGDAAPNIVSGFSGSGHVYLSANEHTELNIHLPAARDYRLVASSLNLIASALTPIPSINIEGAFWGIGGSSNITSGPRLASIVKTFAEISQIVAGWEQDQAGMASRYASYERRADEWLLQHNLAVHEIKQIGRQILTSLIAEQIAHHEYENVQQQIGNAQEVDQFLHEKFTNEDLYLWMQGEISRLYYEYYRFAFDTARRAERAMKQELMRPELDAQDFVKFNYWDAGRKGLLSGEALYLDVKRMEMAYHDNNKRELELTKHVSLRQLNPLQLLNLKATGSCQVTIPEWLYDLDGPGHYMRRIKSVMLSIPSVVGPYTSVNCTLSLLRSSVRKSPLPKGNEYIRQGSEDDRFIDYTSTIQSIVTSGAVNDSGMFELNLRDERFLPFENAGAESTWKLDLPNDYRSFDYNTIADVILHIRYTARQGVDATKVKTALDNLLNIPDQMNLMLLFSLRYDFPSEWSAFVNSGRDFSAAIRRDFFPYFTQGKIITIHRLELYGQNTAEHQTVNEADWGNMSESLRNANAFTVVSAANTILNRAVDNVFLIIRYSLS